MKWLLCLAFVLFSCSEREPIQSNKKNYFIGEWKNTVKPSERLTFTENMEVEKHHTENSEKENFLYLYTADDWLYFRDISDNSDQQRYKYKFPDFYDSPTVYLYKNGGSSYEEFVKLRRVKHEIIGEGKADVYFFDREKGAIKLTEYKGVSLPWVSEEKEVYSTARAVMIEAVGKGDLTLKVYENGKVKFSKSGKDQLNINETFSKKWY